ncbi:MAG: metal-sensing transcriptional repressor [Microgenomates group bacterium]
MKSIDQRLNNILGQIEGVKKMMEGKCECEKVLMQLKAVKSGISRVIEEIVESQFCDDKKLLIKYKKYVKSS